MWHPLKWLQCFLIQIGANYPRIQPQGCRFPTARLARGQVSTPTSKQALLTGLHPHHFILMTSVTNSSKVFFSQSAHDILHFILLAQIFAQLLSLKGRLQKTIFQFKMLIISLAFSCFRTTLHCTLLEMLLSVAKFRRLRSCSVSDSDFMVIILTVSLFSLLQIDHFGFLEDGTFKQRYLLSDKHWQQPGGPVLFYTGNEGDITWFCNNTVNIQLLPRARASHMVLGLIRHLLFSR